jgi:hypothetical protein
MAITDCAAPTAEAILELVAVTRLVAIERTSRDLRQNQTNRMARHWLADQPGADRLVGAEPNFKRIGRSRCAYGDDAFPR